MRYKAIWAGNGPYSKFLLSVGIILISVVLFTLLSTLLASAFYGVSIQDIQNMINDLENPQTISILKLVQTLTAIGTFILPPFLLAYFFYEHPLRFLSVDKPIQFQPSLYVIIALLSSVPLINFLGEVNAGMHLPGFLKSVEDWMRDSEDKASLITKAFLNMPEPVDLWINLLMIAIIPALGEELLFRGVIQRIFNDWSKNVHVGVWISAILFSAMHMQFYGFIPRMMLGVLLGYLLVWSGSLWLPVLAHFINNAAAVIFTYLFQHQFIQTDPDAIGTEEGVASLVISSLLLTAIPLLLTYRFYRKRQLHSAE